MDEILKFIKENSDFLNLAWALLGAFLSFVSTLLFFKIKNRREKRSSAAFGFYAKLKLQLKDLQAVIALGGDKNPFGVLIDKEVRRANSIKLPFGDEKQCVMALKPIAEEIKKLIIESEANIYPRWCKRKDWYNNQYVVYEFSQLISDYAENIYMVALIDDYDTKFSSLKNSINSLLEELEKVRY